MPDPEVKFVHLTDPDSVVHDYSTIQAALSDAESNSWATVSIVCDPGYEGEDTDVGSLDVNASVEIYGSNVTFNNNNVSINGTIELGTAAGVSSVNEVQSDGIVLGTSAEMTAGSMIYSNESITVEDSAEMVSGTTIFAVEDIVVGSSASISGATIYAGGYIEVDASSTVATTGDGYGGIEVWGSDDDDNSITLGSKAKMISGSTIYAYGNIVTGSRSSIQGETLWWVPAHRLPAPRSMQAGILMLRTVRSSRLRIRPDRKRKSAFRHIRAASRLAPRQR